MKATSPRSLRGVFKRASLIEQVQEQPWGDVNAGRNLVQISGKEPSDAESRGGGVGGVHEGSSRSTTPNEPRCCSVDGGSENSNLEQKPR